MKPTYLITILIFFTFFTSSAQIITVLDSAKKTPVAGATVAVYIQGTGKIETQGATDAAGNFTSVQPQVDTYISVVAIGYKKSILKQIQANQTILLVADAKQLKQVTITGSKSPIRFNSNVMEYDISQVPNAEYLSLTDIISYLPFLNVTEKGEIRMMDETLTILIDNKPNVIYKDGPSLRALPPQAIDKVEVTLTPTARNGGKTLNITLKRDYFLGWNGNVDLSLSRLGYGPTGSVSYWRKKFGFDASVSYNSNSVKTSNNTSINYLQEQRTLNSVSNAHNKSSRGTLSFSSFYNINDFDALDFQFSIYPSKNNTLTNSTVATQSLSGSEVTLSAITNNTSGLGYSASLNYTHKYAKAGNVFYLLSRFYNVSSDRDQLLVNSANSGGILPDNRFLADANNIEGTFEAVFQRNSNKAFRYTTGSKLITRDNKTDNTLNVGGVPVITPFKMQQLVSSTYADADWSIKKITVHSGLRFDYNNNSFTLPAVSRQEFFNLTPNLSLTYNINQANLLIFTYGRRVTRPGVYALSPVIAPSSPYQQISGSQNVGNQVSNDWGAQFFGNYKWARIGFTLNHSQVSGLIRELSTVGADNVILTTSINVDKYKSYTAGFSADFTLMKKFRVSHQSNYSYLIQRSGVYSNTLWSGYLSDRISYQLNKSNSFDLTVLAYSPNVNLQGVDQSMAYLNWGLNYGHYFDLLKKFPTSVRISISNPTNYNGLPGYSTVNAPTFTMRSDTRRANPVISASIRVQIKGKQLGNRTFNKSKSIQNNDLSVGGS